MPVNTAERFEALLKLQDGTVLAKGHARVLLAQKAVSFECDFVPLYPMGTPMEVVRLYQGKEIHRFLGKVYLSDKQLMRIVSVDDVLLPGAEDLYCHDMPFSADFSLCPPEQTDGGPFRWLRGKQIFQEFVFQAHVTEISSKGLTFQYDIEQPFEVGQRFLVKTHAPLPLPETIVEIEKPFCFGTVASYRCQFCSLPASAEENLRYFLTQYHLKKHKLF